MSAHACVRVYRNDASRAACAGTVSMGSGFLEAVPRRIEEVVIKIVRDEVWKYRVLAKI